MEQLSPLNQGGITDKIYEKTCNLTSHHNILSRITNLLSLHD
jgi:hypothetical protein